MKTNGTTEVLPLGKRQKTACSIVMGVLLLVAGVILVLSGVGIIPAPVGVVAAPTLLFGFGISILVSAIIARNSISMWISGVILACGLTSLFAAVTVADYGNLYPMYIAAPGIGCAFSLVFAENKAAVVKPMVFFGGLAAVFSLSSSGACGWGVTGGVLAAYLGACVIAYALSSHLGKEKNDA